MNNPRKCVKKAGIGGGGRATTGEGTRAKK
jgi:hypothetical protein